MNDAGQAEDALRETLSRALSNYRRNTRLERIAVLTVLALLIILIFLLVLGVATKRVEWPILLSSGGIVLSLFVLSLRAFLGLMSCEWDCEILEVHLVASGAQGLTKALTDVSCRNLGDHLSAVERGTNGR